MLPSVDTLSNQISSLPPVVSEIQGITNLVDVIADFINQVQAGSGGTPGILTYNNAVAIAILDQLPNVDDNSWIKNFATGVHAGVLAGTITPGTVTNAAWVTSTVDVATVPSPSATITTLSSALELLIQELAPATYNNNPPMPMAQAINDYVKSFVFLCIGIGPTPPGSPVPISFPAE